MTISKTTKARAIIVSLPLWFLSLLNPICIFRIILNPPIEILGYSLNRGALPIVRYKGKQFHNIAYNMIR